MINSRLPLQAGLLSISVVDTRILVSCRQCDEIVVFIPQAERMEKEKMKQMVLNIHERQEEEDYQGIPSCFSLALALVGIYHLSVCDGASGHVLCKN